MRVKLCYLCGMVLLAVSAAFGQLPDTVWSCTVEYPGNPELNRVIQLSNSDVLSVGKTHIGVTDYMFAVRVDPAGRVVWANHYPLGVSFSEQAFTALELPGNNLVLAGYGNNNYRICLRGLSANGAQLWSRIVIPNPNDPAPARAFDLLSLSDGNFMAVGYFNLPGRLTDVLLMKCRPNGDTLWTRSYGGMNYDEGWRLSLLPNGLLLIAGSTSSGGGGDFDCMLMTVNTTTGDLVSSRTFGDSRLNRCLAISTLDSTIYMAGRSLDAGSSSYGYIVKATPNTVAEWAHTYGPGGIDDQFRGIAMQPGGELACVGWSGSEISSTAWLTMLRQDGTLETSWLMPGHTSSKFTDIILTDSSGFVLCGTVLDSTVSKGYLLRLGEPNGLRGIIRSSLTNQPLGNVRVSAIGRTAYTVTGANGRYFLALPEGTYQIVMAGPCVSTDTIPAVEVFPDSVIERDLVVSITQFEATQTSINVVVPNHTTASSPLVLYNRGNGEMSYSITSTPSTPAFAWLSTLPAAGYIQPHDSVIIAVRAHADTTDDGVYDYYGYITVHANSCPDSVRRMPVQATVLDVPQREFAAVTDYALRPAYPNPFNPTTTVTFDVPRPSPVKIVVFDIMGRTVQTLTDEPLAAGRYHLAFDGSRLASGLYIVRMSADGFAASQKLMLMK